ncbi:hypothetical protein BDU57DRAFT_525767 [Ampelomyces quisqualis]|uniref:Uncharacterized protein n=1 Tax=Ampelomyces quisqualis TaxID=50730 RepID=A0A6A5QY87_AMPQU|nr:hypothetical protein BDU57DRAFT_525767 [Ampelomyces quisqualis]
MFFATYTRRNLALRLYLATPYNRRLSICVITLRGLDNYPNVDSMFLRQSLIRPLLFATKKLSIEGVRVPIYNLGTLSKLGLYYFSIEYFRKNIRRKSKFRSSRGFT